MSLLNSSKTTKDNLQFIDKMEKYFTRKTSSNHKIKTSKEFLSTKVPSQCVDALKEHMKDFMDKIKQLISKFQIVDHYYVLDLLRKHQFFSDVAMYISIDVLGRVAAMEQELIEKNALILGLKKDLRSSSIDKKTTKIQQKPAVLNPSKSLAANIYNYAKSSNQSQFIQYYDRIALNKKITLKNVKFPESSHRQLVQVLEDLISFSKNSIHEDKLQQLIDLVKTLVYVKKCKNPCCQDKQEQPDTRQNKAQSVIASTLIRPTQNFYTNDKSQEYFTRYYRGESFNVNDIKSVERTKLQEMERIESQYKKNVKKRQKYQTKHRYSNSFTNNYI